MLLNQSKNKIVAPKLRKATGLYDRLKGLLGTTSLDESEALWINASNSAHTFFMNYPIDIVFIDRSLKVKKIYTNVRPWRLVGPVLSAYSMIEFAAGVTVKNQMEVGDQLHVGH